MSLPSRLLGANPSIQVSTLLSGSLSTPSAKQAFIPPQSYWQISSSTLSSSQDSITLSDIPQTYDILVLRGAIYPVVSGSTESNYGIRVNGDSGANYNRNNLISDGGTQAALYQFGDTSFGFGYTYGTWAHTYPAPVVFQCIIPNYTGSSNYKSMILQNGIVGPTVGGTSSQACVWKSTSAITSVTLVKTGGTSMKSGTVFALYGIRGS